MKKITANGNIKGVRCYAHFNGIDGMGTCNVQCQWWRNDYLKPKDRGCVMWQDKIGKTASCFHKRENKIKRFWEGDLKNGFSVVPTRDLQTVQASLNEINFR